MILVDLGSVVMFMTDVSMEIIAAMSDPFAGPEVIALFLQMLPF